MPTKKATETPETAKPQVTTVEKAISKKPPPKNADGKSAEANTAVASAKISGKLSALDAAAKVLAEAGGAITTKAMIDAMAARGYWSSPGGKTPHATLDAAILREITSKGDNARFQKTERGPVCVATGGDRVDHTGRAVCRKEGQEDRCHRRRRMTARLPE